MRPFTTLRIALRALWVHKGRSFLTSLGIIIGIGSVIAMVSAGDGVQQKLDDEHGKRRQEPHRGAARRPLAFRRRH